MKGLLRRSVDSQQRLEMIYISSDNQISQRVIKVLEVQEESIKAYCYRRKKFRTFKLCNILSIGPVRKQYKEGA